MCSLISPPVLESPQVKIASLVAPYSPNHRRDVLLATRTDGRRTQRRIDESRFSGCAYCDAPDLRNVLRDRALDGGKSDVRRLNRRGDLDRTIDFANLRHRLAVDLGVGQFVFVDDAAWPRLHRRVRKAGWQIVIASRPQTGFSQNACTDWISHQLTRRAWPIPSTIVLTGHNADYARPATTYLDRQVGHLVLAGLIGEISRTLYVACSDSPRARLVDLQFDLHVARVRRVWPTMPVSSPTSG